MVLPGAWNTEGLGSGWTVNCIHSFQPKILAMENPCAIQGPDFGTTTVSKTDQNPQHHGAYSQGWQTIKTKQMKYTATWGSEAE